MGSVPVVLVVLDSNILLSALLSPHGTPARIYDEWQDGRFTLVTCPHQIDEIRVASRYPKLRSILKPHLVGKMVNSLQHASVIENAPRKYTADDPTDAFLLDLAEYAKVDYVVTGDKRSGLLKRKRIGNARILTAAYFMSNVLR